MKLASPSHPVDWGVAQQAAPQESVTGDAYLILPHSHGLLLAVIDGCGHGPEAAHAARLATETLREQPERSVLDHLTRCHAALAGSRGVVMTLADFDSRDRTLTLCAIGNVEAVLFRAGSVTGDLRQESAVLRGGVVGDHLPAPFATIIPVNPGDVLVMASDGLRTDFAPEAVLRAPPQQAASLLLRKHAKGNDDALVLVARFPEHRHE